MMRESQIQLEKSRHTLISFRNDNESKYCIMHSNITANFDTANLG